MIKAFWKLLNILSKVVIAYFLWLLIQQGPVINLTVVAPVTCGEDPVTNQLENIPPADIGSTERRIDT